MTRTLRSVAAKPVSFSFVLAPLLAVALWACVSELPTPHYVAQPASALVHVHTPPPPARVETVPAKPASGAVWLDGEWAWQGRKWAWRRGQWVMPPSGAKYSPWTQTRDLNGDVWFASGAWRNAAGEEVTPPEALAVAEAGRSEVTDANGEKEETGRNVRDTKRDRDAGEKP